MRPTILTGAVVSLCMLAALPAALASPSGLNNIPTADVVPLNVEVLQLYSGFGEGRAPSHVLGAKVGVAPGLEMGADFEVLPDQGPATFQAKYRIGLGSGLALALGAADVSGEEEIAGKWMPYAVASKDLGAFRLHLGYSGQSDNKGVFVGADAPVGGGVTLRSDWLENNGGDGSLASLGSMWELTPTWVIEGWGSFPSAAGHDDSYLLKLDYVVPTH